MYVLYFCYAYYFCIVIGATSDVAMYNNVVLLLLSKADFPLELIERVI